MDVVLGLLGLAIFIPCVVLFAAAITWTVVRLTPSKKPSAAEPAKP